MKTDKELYKSIIDHIDDGVYFLDKDRVIRYWSKGAEKISGYKSSEIAGSSCSDNILVHIDGNGKSLCECSLCPAYQTIQSGQTIEVERVYMHHKDGCRIPVSIRTSAIFDNQNNIVGAVEIFKEFQNQTKQAQELAELKKLTLIDQLTEVRNRRFGEIKISNCMNQFNRYDWPFGLLFFDIDFFKQFNDNYGHETGDKVLKMVANTLSSSLRSFDVLVRWGGEEFLAIIMNVGEDSLLKIAEHLRVLVEKSFIEIGGKK
ncbi:MAG: diguanylate cyclase [Planctomycetes bacterium]|nr:diguanylate cyclase [Planctomycetota bacterium]